MANIVDPDQTAPIGAVCSGSTLFASVVNSSVMLGIYLQQTTSADDIFRCIFFLDALRVKNITKRYRRVGYTMDIMQQAACLVVKPITFIAMVSFLFAWRCIRHKAQ